MPYSFINPPISNEQVKLRFKEPYTSKGLNRKMSVNTPPGVYRGFLLEASDTASCTVLVKRDPEFLDHSLVYQSLEDNGDLPASKVPGYSLTIWSEEPFYSLSLANSYFLGKTVVLTVYADYTVGGTTTAEFRAYTLAEWDNINPAVYPERREVVVLGTVDVPSDPGVLLPAANVFYDRRTIAWTNVAKGANEWSPVLRNSGFEWSHTGEQYRHAVAYWEIEAMAGGTISASETGVRTGKKCLQFNSSGGLSGWRVSQQVGVPVEEGKYVRAQAYVQQVLIPAGDVLLQLYWGAADGSDLGPTDIALSSATADTSYRLVEKTIAVPATACTLKRVVLNGDLPVTWSGTGVAIRFDGVQVYVERTSAYDSRSMDETQLRPQIVDGLIVYDSSEATPSSSAALLRYSAVDNRLYLERKDGAASPKPSFDVGEVTFTDLAVDYAYVKYKIGVGPLFPTTTSPTDSLHLYGDNSNAIVIQNNVADLTDSTVKIMFKPIGGYAAEARKAAVIAHRPASYGWGRTDLAFAVDTADDMGDAAVGDSKIFISGSTGYVAVGNTGPKAAFEVGDYHLSFQAGGLVDGGGTLYYPTSYAGFNAAHNAADSWFFRGDAFHNGGVVAYGDVYGSLHFAVKASSSGADETLTNTDIRDATALTLYWNKYLGIGTVQPAKNIHIYDATTAAIRIEVATGSSSWDIRNSNSLFIAHNNSNKLSISPGGTVTSFSGTSGKYRIYSSDGSTEQGYFGYNGDNNLLVRNWLSSPVVVRSASGSNLLEVEDSGGANKAWVTSEGNIYSASNFYGNYVILTGGVSSGGDVTFTATGAAAINRSAAGVIKIGDEAYTTEVHIGRNTCLAVVQGGMTVAGQTTGWSFKAEGAGTAIEAKAGDVQAFDALRGARVIVTGNVSCGSVTSAGTINALTAAVNAATVNASTGVTAGTGSFSGDVTLGSDLNDDITVNGAMLIPVGAGDFDSRVTSKFTHLEVGGTANGYGDKVRVKNRATITNGQEDSGMLMSWAPSVHAYSGHQPTFVSAMGLHRAQDAMLYEDFFSTSAPAGWVADMSLGGSAPSYGYEGRSRINMFGAVNTWVHTSYGLGYSTSQLTFGVDLYWANTSGYCYLGFCETTTPTMLLGFCQGVEANELLYLFFRDSGGVERRYSTGVNIASYLNTMLYLELSFSKMGAQPRIQYRISGSPSGGVLTTGIWEATWDLKTTGFSSWKASLYTNGGQDIVVDRVAAHVASI